MKLDGFHVYVMKSTQNKLITIEAQKVYYWQLYSIWYAVSPSPVLFNQHNQLSTEILDEFISTDSMENNTRSDNFQQFLLWNIGDTTENKPVLYQKLEFIGCSSDISIDHFQFRECTQLSFHSLLHEKKVTGCYVHPKSHLVQSFHVSQLVS